MSDEATLLERIRQYDMAALAQVYDDYYERIYRYIYCYLGQVGAAEDLTANVFFRLLSAVRNGRSPRQNLVAWLYRVAHNLVVDTFRRMPAEELELAEWLESPEPDLVHMVEQRIQMDRVRLALRQLTASQQQVIVLKFFEGLDSREVATIIGKSEGAVDALQHRALLALRKALVQSQGPGAQGKSAASERGEASPLQASTPSDKPKQITGEADHTLSRAIRKLSTDVARRLSSCSLLAAWRSVIAWEVVR